MLCETLLIKSHPQAVDSLHTLATNRHALSSISTNEVATLLQVLQYLWRDQAIPAAQRTTAFSQTYHLLARWAHIQRSTARNSTDHSQLQESVSGALQLLQSHWCTAQLSAACILFLGAASQGKNSDHLTLHLQAFPADVNPSLDLAIFQICRLYIVFCQSTART